MKKVILAILLFTGVAEAQTCASKLMPAFTAAQAVEICTGVSEPTISGTINGISGLNLSTANGFETVAGAGTNQGSAAALSATKHFHRITGANGTVGWLLPAASAGDIHVMLNTTAGVADLYPQTGGTINGAAANAVFEPLTGIKPIICIATTALDWICS